MNNITKYMNLADLITVLGSIDFVLGSVDLLNLVFKSSNIKNT